MWSEALARAAAMDAADPLRPGALRLSFAPFYNSYSDVCRCVRTLEACLAPR